MIVAISPTTPLLIILLSICHDHHNHQVEAYGFGPRSSVKSPHILIHHHYHTQDRTVGRRQRQSTPTVALHLKVENDDEVEDDSISLPLLKTEMKQIILSANTPLAEIITCRPTNTSNTKPQLIFIHGSFHASWCWAEHCLPHFASAGYPCYALSLRGTGGTSAGEGVTEK